MISTRLKLALAAIALSASAIAHSANTSTSAAPNQQTFTAGKGTFLLNGEPYVIKAAELHYPRIPRPYWDHRIKMCKALGMNTICLYVFWNAHESRPGEFDFTGQNDLRAFVELCRDNDMNVILRPGPYVCAEWEMGGLPWWLLKIPGIRLRENDSRFLERVEIFQKEVAEQVSGLTAPEGGPIIMVQVENEYGSYGEDKEYVGAIRDMLRRHFGEELTMFQCDWASNFTLNGLPDLVWTMNFGTGADIDSQFEKLKELRPDSPLMCSEFWSGWFDKWGANHETRPADDMIAGIDEMLSKGISFSLYMTHGGTNWGHWAGANSPGFAPDVTSYDYDAPIDEAGHTTPKYHLLRSTLARHNNGRHLARIPDEIPVTAIKEFSLTEVAPLFDNLPHPVTDSEVLTMEQLDQGFGSVLYRTRLPELENGATLTFAPHDYARVFINGKLIGTLDRRNGDTTLTLPPTSADAELDILVEAMGRINFGRAINDRKGIAGSVKLSVRNGSHEFVCDLRNWEMFPIPDELDFYTSRNFVPLNNTGQTNPPGVYRGTFHVNKPADTFLDFSSWGKGLVYVNGHPLGRFWEIGPQQTLYTPGCWLRKGENEIVVFDITGPQSPTVEGLKQPVLDRVRTSKPQTDASAMPLDLDSLSPAVDSVFAEGNGWQTVRFPAPAHGRYVTLRALANHDGGEISSIAELYLLDENGRRLSREPWKAIYADSENTNGLNCTADKVFDLQESTFWSSAPGAPLPHTLIIDLGESHTVTALEYLPRMESSAPGSISRFEVFVTD